MRRIRLILAALICLGALAVYFGIARRGAGPVYEGRSLEYWLEAYEANRTTEAEVAVRAIGTNAFPYLLKWVAYEPRGRQDPFDYLINRVKELRGAGTVNTFVYPESELHCFKLAHSGFGILREDASPTAPALASLLNHSNRFVQVSAVDALASIGRNGLPSLLQAVSNANHSVHVPAVLAVINMRNFYSEHSQTTIPALIRCIQDPDPFVATTVIRALPVRGVQKDKVFTALTNAFASPNEEVRYEAVHAFRYSWKQEATNAAPALRSMLSDPDSRIREVASIILSQIDGDAGTNTPPP